MKKIFQIYWELTKPRLVFMALTTLVTGYWLALAPQVSFTEALTPALFWALLGSTLVFSGSAALNNYLERDNDLKMNRTKDRVLPTGVLQPEKAFLFGLGCILSGIALLLLHCSLWTAFLALLAAFLYVVVYTPMKRISSWNTFIGSIPGALPPVLGWTLARGRPDLGAVIPFFILMAWQHPHFFAIAWIFREDYRNADLKMLPVLENQRRNTVLQVLFFTVLLVQASLLPAWFGRVGTFYTAGILILGGLFLAMSLEFIFSWTELSARRLLRMSLVYLPAQLLLVLADGFIAL